MNEITFYTVLSLALFVTACGGTAILELKLLSFSNPEGKVAAGTCCESFSKRTCTGYEARCDHQFTVCLDRVNRVYDQDNVDSCGYKGPLFSGQRGFEGNNLQFKGDIGRVVNPITYRFLFNWPGGVRVKVMVEDEDTIYHDLVELFLQDHFLKPDGKVHRVLLKGVHQPKTRLEYEISVRCELGYYGDSCSRHCSAQNGPLGHYRCHPTTGDKLCLAGWKDNTTDCVTPTACLKNSCKNGATCFDRLGGNDFSCICSKGFTGRYCEVYVGVTTTPQILTTKLPSACNPNPCKNSGMCVSALGARAYACLCSIRYTGDHCETLNYVTTTRGPTNVTETTPDVTTRPTTPTTTVVKLTTLLATPSTTDQDPKSTGVPFEPSTESATSTAKMGTSAGPTSETMVPTEQPTTVIPTTTKPETMAPTRQPTTQPKPTETKTTVAEPETMAPTQRPTTWPTPSVVTIDVRPSAEPTAAPTVQPTPQPTEAETEAPPTTTQPDTTKLPTTKPEPTTTQIPTTTETATTPRPTQQPTTEEVQTTTRPTQPPTKQPTTTMVQPTTVIETEAPVPTMRATTSPPQQSTKEALPCDSEPCLNGSKCVESAFSLAGYRCYCQGGYTGKHCETQTLI